MFPFAKLLVKLSGIIVPEKKTEQIEEISDKEELEISRHFDDRILGQPSVAVERAKNEVINMGRLAYDNIEIASRAVRENSQELVDRIYELEKEVDYYSKYLTSYLIKLNNQSLSDKQHLLVNDLFHAVIDIERVSDHAENLADLTKYKIEHDIVFSQRGQDELRQLWDKVLCCFDRAVVARETGDDAAIRDVYRIEDEVDDLEEELRDKHIKRLSDGKCLPSNGVVFLDILSNLERMSDHAKNITECVQEEISSN